MQEVSVSGTLYYGDEVAVTTANSFTMTSMYDSFSANVGSSMLTWKGDEQNEPSNNGYTSLNISKEGDQTLKRGYYYGSLKFTITYTPAS
jgi:hypothetical protein